MTGTAYDLDGQELATSDPGTNLAVTNATCSGTTATVFYASTSHYPPQGSDVFITGINPAGYNGAWKTTLSASDHVQYTVPSCTGMTYVGGGLLAPSASAQTYDAVGNQITSTDYGATPSVTSDAYDALDRQTTETVPGSGLTVTNDAWSSASCNGSAGTQTITHAATSVPAPKTGSFIVVTGINPSSLDGTFQVAGSTASTVWYCQASSPGTYSSGGTATSATDTTYYANGNQQTSTDGDGNVELDTYYPSGQQATVYSGYGSSAQTSETYTYDAAGNTLTDQSGSNTDTSTYNDVGWNLTAKDQLGDTTTYAYDAMGNVKTETDPSNGGGSPVTHSYYDGAGRLLGTCVDGVPSGDTCQTQLNQNQPGQDQVSNSYDHNGNVVSATDANSTTTGSGAGNPWQQASFTALGGQDLAKTATDPKLRSTTSTYNAAGDLATQTNPDGKTATYSYDGSGRVTGISYGDGITPSVSYTYNSDGTVAGMTDGSGTTTYTYDGQGNLATETDGNGDQMKYVWDQAGNLASVTYADGNTVAYAYDGQGRMSSLTDWLGNTTGFKYDSGGNLTETDYPNSTVTTYTYDSAERLNKIATTKSGVAQFSFDAAGSNGSLNPDGSIKKFSTVQIAGYNLTPGSSGAAGTDTYTYDPLSRMTADTQSGSGSASISSSFDNNGEIATTNGGGPQNGTYGHDTTGSDAGQLNSITSGSNVTSFGYNGEGDTTSCSATTGTPCSSAGSATYTFDEENRLIKETDSLKGPETMLYDGNGLLQQEKETIPGACPAIVKGAVKRHAPAPMTASPSLSCLYTDQLTWSTALGDPTLASTHTWSSSLDLGTTDYVMGPDGQPVEQLTTLGTSTTPEWYYADFQGNTRVLMDASGSPQVTYNYPAWGATTDWLGNGNGTPLQYNATFTDQWTGLVYDQARWYDPSTGQFVSQDPMVGQTLQPYAYAADSPTGMSDPTGLSPHHKWFSRWGGETAVGACRGRHHRHECTWGLLVGGRFRYRDHGILAGSQERFADPDARHCWGSAVSSRAQRDLKTVFICRQKRHKLVYTNSITLAAALVVWVCLKRAGGCVRSDTFAYILTANFFDGFPTHVKLIGSGIRGGPYLECSGACDNSLPEHEDCYQVCEPKDFTSSPEELDDFAWQRNLYEWDGL